MPQPIPTPRQLGEIFRARRKARGLSQQEFAAMLGISQSRLSSLETDASGMSLERVLNIAKLLGLEILVQDTPDAARSTGKW